MVVGSDLAAYRRTHPFRGDLLAVSHRGSTVVAKWQIEKDLTDPRRPQEDRQHPGCHLIGAQVLSRANQPARV